MKFGALRTSLIAAGTALALALTFTAPAAAQGNETFIPVKHRTINGSVDNSKAYAPAKTSRTTNGISYHGGSLILGTTNLYVIWYGSWSNNTATTIIPDFLSHLGGSSYYNINTTYYNGAGTKVSNSVASKGSTTDNYSQGTAFGDAGVQAIVSSAISSGRLPADANGIYLVLTSSDVNETSGFLTQYCGWHSHATMSGQDIKFAFIGDPARNYSACAGQSTSSPNNNISADAMVSVIAHEVEEAVTDPDLNAWYDSRGYENADKCAWTWGTTSTASNGSKYNMTLGTRQYLIQQNWVNANGGLCAKSY